MEIDKKQNPGEKVYYQGKTDSSVNLRNALFPEDYGLLRGIILILFLGLFEILAPVMESFFSLILCAPIQLLLIFFYLRGIWRAITGKSEVEYYITDAGIYTRTKKEKSFTLARFDCIDSVNYRMKKRMIGSIDLKMDFTRSTKEYVRLPFIDNCEEVYRFIFEQRKAQLNRLQQLSPQMPLSRGDVKESQRKFFSDSPDKSDDMIPDGYFLKDIVSEAELMQILGKGNVQDLQTELFGTDPELTGAFPDPTVNPLPEFQEQGTENKQFMQGGEDQLPL